MAEVHKHILVTGYLDKAPDSSYIPFLEDWFRRLVKAVDMKILIEPNCVWCPTEGNEGVTGIVCIETSHCTIHYWSEPQPYYRFDLYSCKDYSLDIVASMLKELGTTKISYSMIDRTNDEKPIIESGIINF